MLKPFTKIFTRVLQKHASLKNEIIRNNKSSFARSQTWLKEKNKEPYHSLFISYNNSGERWNHMNDVRNSARTSNHIYSLKYVFNDYVPEPKKIANLLNYWFSQLGKLILSHETCEYIKDFADR